MDQTSYESGGLYYYYYPTDENTTDSILETTTAAVANEDEQADFDFSGLQKLMIILLGISLAFPSRISLDSVRKKRSGD